MSQQLPTFTVTDEQAARLMAVFGTPAAYKAWLRRQIVEAVKRHEATERDRMVREYAASLEPLGGDVIDAGEQP